MNLKGLVVLFIILGFFVSVSTPNDEPLITMIGFVDEGIDFQFSSVPNYLNLTSRVVIINFIQNTPGVHLREISSVLGLSIGSTQYHLDKLLEGGLLEAEKDSKYKRFFQARRFSVFEKRLFSLFNRSTTGKIIKLLYGNREMNHQTLASSLGISSQAVTWQIKLLRENSVINSVKSKIGTKYYLTEETVRILEGLGLVTRGSQLVFHT